MEILIQYANGFVSIVYQKRRLREFLRIYSEKRIVLEEGELTFSSSFFPEARQYSFYVRGKEKHMDNTLVKVTKAYAKRIFYHMRKLNG